VKIGRSLRFIYIDNAEGLSLSAFLNCDCRSRLTTSTESFCLLFSSPLSLSCVGDAYDWIRSVRRSRSHSHCRPRPRCATSPPQEDSTRGPSKPTPTSRARCPSHRNGQTALEEATSSSLCTRVLRFFHPAPHTTSMGKLIKNHWARLIIMTAASCKPRLSPLPILPSPPRPSLPFSPPLPPPEPPQPPPTHPA